MFISITKAFTLRNLIPLQRMIKQQGIAYAELFVSQQHVYCCHPGSAAHH